jgi:hypothetical protein
MRDHARNTGPMLASQRCGAKIRSGGACRSPAVRGRKRCRMHGGAPGSGPPRGNRNARNSLLIGRKVNIRWAHVLKAIVCAGPTRSALNGTSRNLHSATTIVRPWHFRSERTATVLKGIEGKRLTCRPANQKQALKRFLACRKRNPLI